MLHRTKKHRTWPSALFTLLCASLMFTMVTPAFAAAPPLKLDYTKSAMLLDFATGQVLFEQNPDAPIAPASLTKLMTLHLAYKKIADGTMKREDRVTIREDAWAARMPGSSVMWLEPGQIVTVGEIMKGVAIPSGNDAAVALADHIAGSVSSFASMMNTEAQAMGYKTMHFVDPAGLQPQNVVTAREFADFARKYVTLHPEALTELHSVKQFTYPNPQNLPPEKKGAPAITQPNRNLLLGENGIDGLKTGFIDESGYNIALTAKQGEMRLVGAILGVEGRSEAEGSRRREAAGLAMLTWGFQNFADVKPTLPNVKPVRVWKGSANEVTLTPVDPLVLTVEKGTENKVAVQATQQTSVMAPVKKGDKLGEVILTVDGKEVKRVNLVASQDVGQGGFIKRMWDSVRLWIAGLFKRK